MKKPIPKIRFFGQRSIAPFLNCTSMPVENPLKKLDKCASFSEFLDSKLNKSVLFKPKNIEDSLVSFKDLTQLSHGFGMEKKGREEKKFSDVGLEKTMLQQFKPRDTQMQTVQDFGTVTWKVLTQKKLDVVKCGKELVRPHSEI